MGAGASSLDLSDLPALEAQVAAASMEDLQGILAALSSDSKSKLQAALVDAGAEVPLPDNAPLPEPDGGYCPCSGAPMFKNPISMGMMMPMMRRMMNNMMAIGPANVEPTLDAVKDHEDVAWHAEGKDFDLYSKWRPYNLKSYENQIPAQGAPAPDGPLVHATSGEAPSTLLAECKALADAKGTPMCGVLFCSITCPVGRTFANHDFYKACAKKGFPVLCVYTLEAHPYGEGGFHTPVNESGAMALSEMVPEHQTEDDRRRAAEGMRQVLKRQLGHEVSMWLDGMGDDLERAYETRPFRFYLLNTADNTVALGHPTPCPLNIPAKVTMIKNFA